MITKLIKQYDHSMRTDDIGMTKRPALWFMGIKGSDSVRGQSRASSEFLV